MALKPLDPDEALAGPLYAVALILVAMSTLDFLQSVGGIQPRNIQWRFATVGLLSSFLAMPLLGSAIAVVVATIRGHHVVQRILGGLNIAAALVLILLLVAFALDAIQLRGTVPAEARRAFEAASLRAAAKHLLAIGGLAYLGWRTLRLAPVSRAPREQPRAVPLVNR